MSGEQQAHPWRLVAPWWSWSPADDPQAGRGTGPLLQMFAADDFVDGFLARPQHSLRFDESVDVVQRVGLLSGGATPPTLAQLEADVKAVRLVSTNTRKLFLPIHGRHYLVSASLHCDEREFPAVAPAQVCNTGFVVRRLSSPVPRALERELQQLQTTRDRAAAEWNELQLRGPLRAHLAWARRRRIEQLEQRGELAAARLAAQQQLAAAEAAISSWRLRHGITQQVEYWQADASDPDSGAWLPLSAEHQLAGPADEQVFPLRRLHAPPDQPQHEASGRTIFFGAVPTTSAQHDRAGRPRFDDRALYEIRCFVTRRRGECTKPPGFAGCKGTRVWSLASESFRLASAMDPVGCANRPITIRMPDLRELLAQAVARPRGALSNVRVVHQQQIAPKVSGGEAQGGAPGGEAICHFSIPLITIVAMFLLNLFLPIVVLLFNLWYLLAFRFCIPPSVGLGGGIDAAAKITNLLSPDGDFSAGLTVDGVFKDATQVRNDLRQGLATQWGGDNGPDAAAAAQTMEGARLARDARNAMDNRVAVAEQRDTDGRLIEPAMPTPTTPAPEDFLDHPRPQSPRVRVIRSTA